MKTITPSTLSEINKKIGIEPITYVQIILDTGTLFYGDEHITVNNISWNGKILDVSQIRYEKTADNRGNVGSVSITLDDKDFYLKNLMQSVQIVGKRAIVYQSFQDASDFINMLDGKIVTPVEWNDTDRTFKFEILAKLESNEIGCKITRDEDLNLTTVGVAEDAYDQVIPLVFGTVINVPAVKILEPITGILRTPIGTWPFTNGYPFFTQTLQIEGGENFPQGVEITIKIGSIPITGIMNGTAFTVVEFLPDEEPVTIAQAGEQVQWSPIAGGGGKDYHIIHINEEGRDLLGKCLYAEQTQYSTTAGSLSAPSGGFLTTKWVYRVLKQEGTKLYLNYPIAQDPYGAAGLWGKRLPEESLLSVAPCARFSWWTIEPGAKVVLGGSRFYAVNCVPSVEVIDVKAYRNDIKDENGIEQKVLASVPIYTVHLSYPLGTKLLTVIELTEPLGTMWEDQLYVSLKSTLSPNTSKVLRYLLTTYTNVTIDETSFNVVELLIENYPSHFALLKDGDAFEIATEIAWQARLAILLDSNIARLIYLSKEPAFLDTINDEKTEEATPLIYFTNLEDIRTDIIATYKLDLAEEDETIRHFKNNIEKFGKIKEDVEFYIYSHEELIIKSLTFWGYRWSNQWIRMKLDTFVSQINNELFDCLKLDYDLLVAKSILEDFDYDSKDGRISIDFWTSIVAGSSTQSPYAWLSDSGDVKPNDPTTEVKIIPYAPGEMYIKPRPDEEETQEEIYLGEYVEDEEDNNGKVLLFEDGYENPATGTVIATKLTETSIEPGTKILVKRDEQKRHYIEPSGGGLDSARVSTFSNITLSGLQVIDGIQLIEDDLVLVRMQTNEEENGLYKAKADAWEKRPEIKEGTMIPVREGIYQAGAIFVASAQNNIIVEP